MLSGYSWNRIQEHKTTLATSLPHSLCVFVLQSFQLCRARMYWKRKHTSAFRSMRSFEAGDKIKLTCELLKRRYQQRFCAQINLPTKTPQSWSYCQGCGQGSWWCPESCSQACYGRRFPGACGAHNHRYAHLGPDLHEQENKMSEHIAHQWNRTVILQIQPGIIASVLIKGWISEKNLPE